MESWLFAVGSFVSIILLLVIIHELGHLGTAKLFGIKVLEFGLGMPPRAFCFYTGRTTLLVDDRTLCVNGALTDLKPGMVIRAMSGETDGGLLTARCLELPGAGRMSDVPGGEDLLAHEGRIREVGDGRLVLADMLYSLNWLPMGGFVRLPGEDNPAVPGGLARCPIWQRALVVVSGSAVNAVFPVVAFTLLLMAPTVRMVGGDALITEVVPGSPAERGGLQAGDVVRSFEGNLLTEPAELPGLIRETAGREALWEVGRGQQVLMFPVTAAADAGRVGIRFEIVNQVEQTEYRWPWTAAWQGVVQTGAMVSLILDEVQGGVELSGPVGVAAVAGDVTRQYGFDGWVAIAALLSINLAVFNLLPVPPMDGGHLLFMAVEWVRGGRRVSGQVQRVTQLIGFAVLAGLFIVVSASDIFAVLWMFQSSSGG